MAHATGPRKPDLDWYDTYVVPVWKTKKDFRVKT